MTDEADRAAERLGSWQRLSKRPGEAIFRADLGLLLSDRERLKARVEALERDLGRIHQEHAAHLREAFEPLAFERDELKTRTEAAEAEVERLKADMETLHDSLNSAEAALARARELLRYARHWAPHLEMQGRIAAFLSEQEVSTSTSASSSRQPPV